jgi:hypothetical protein
LLVSELEARGHRGICVDLPTDEPAASANRYADLIADVVPEMEAPIVVAHSASGLFLPLLPARVKVARLVYLAAVIPQPGQSFMDQYKSTPEIYCPGFAVRIRPRIPSWRGIFCFMTVRQK